MDIRLKRKIKIYFSSIYLIDVILIALSTLILLSNLGDYIQVNRIQHDLAINRVNRDKIELIILIAIDLVFMLKIIWIVRINPKNPKVQSRIISNMIFVIKNGFLYKETRSTLIVSILLVLVLLIAYLYFLATGGYENNIFVKFFQTYPFKGTIFVIIIIFLTMMYALKKTLDIIVVNEALRRVGQGNLDKDIKLDGSQAIRELAENINLIKAGYKEILENGVRNEKLKTELISNVSHDLKTPLTSIINYVNILKNGEITEEEREEYLSILERKSLRLKVLIEDLFEMSKINSGKIKLNRDLIDIVSLIHQNIGEYSTLYEEKNISFKVTSQQDAVYMELDGKMMSRALENIIINALKYSLDNTRVYVDINIEDNYLKIGVKNIASYEMQFNDDEMFERFARGDKSRNSKVEGSGLGLAITKSIIELHDGEVKIKKEGDMFKIYLILPLKK
ncbi:signal transduction histidine kinase [Clostridium saccharoperbutylacetonicum]|uniref:histidine kinase n=1 Tax=Clostridium saccharoperbutylacetonicum N1-4(HMT) TaxID=931276 RepID=M1MC82_9CLOT|nr:HAMP domain-containing sensor histidine kinase [Clostridium saccharoperbutylacetonicum]AGF54048.1 sensor protein kinase WalK [Clostridium saccharoperbutylacetonicum N1-4(HMT)]NRT59439.1 signal transduction histidine kinase [Clostridium saccharoperbutylacetonicum]NSB28631.1 signal transduction histidine kinase [Clostridium saccharoperbutylacetonicum]NSB42122.1 signal transduction histidine kinase [Clostridium saccharoperbutylacetonicum]